MDLKKIAIFGLGKSNLAAIKALSGQVDLIAWDDQEEAREAAAQMGACVRPLMPDALAECDCLLLAPGVPLHFPEPHDVVKAARAAGIEIICDVELFVRLHPGPKVIGVTGTNGKSTTTALIAHILKEAGIKAEAAGNIGVPVFDLDPEELPDVLVLELSSYQLDLCPDLKPDIGILLNITPDHIDRHGSFEAYKAAKMSMIEKSKSTMIEPDNHKAATKVAKLMGVEDETITAALKTFVNLPHRQKHVRTIGKVTYINDSKGTNAEASAYALERYDGIVLIAGGRSKEGGLSILEGKMQNVCHVFLLGEAQDDFAIWLEAQKIACTKCNALERAVESAHEYAQKNGAQTVLFSPACSSFDQYENFEERGDHFEKLVNRLSERA